ncbi:MAG: dicarboxylate/amino acid:cation symporter [Rhodospirillaceae bacterium]|jgi:Na+/H+-dicarboxylate symporter|nr:dicarboxylate/amino acid:cation symporter [Rhodospirillaceae bacterium]MBT5373278.1 dicarboxylate/amino acid:cation symporter [Rhodospirillaceae bacterium]MBT5659204.1 dicarboxylate/amino acid:cation symporter [Rhodospirillaceae bacterium]
MTEGSAFTLTRRIIFAMLAGGVVGIGINMANGDVGGIAGFLQSVIVEGLFGTVGQIFVTALKMLVVPLVFVSLVCGVVSLGDVHALGRIGVKTVALYLLTTAMAITIALVLASIFAPGEGFQITSGYSDFQPTPPPPLSKVLIGMIPGNPFAAMAQGNMLQLIVFSIIFGISLTLSGDAGQPVVNLFTSLNEVVMKMVGIVMWLAPIGVFCLIGKTFATQGIEVIAPLFGYFAVVVLALGVHFFCSYGSLIAFVARLSPLIFFQKMRAAMIFAFSTASSNATIPVTLRSVEKRLGVDNSVAAFTVPLGATINMDGTAIMQGVATVFISNVYGIGLGMTDYLMIIATATLASIGTAGVPGVGLVMLSMVLLQVGLPVEGVALIIGVDRLLDMLRTAVNITGDAAVTCVVAKSEKAFDETCFKDPVAGLLQID